MLTPYILAKAWPRVNATFEWNKGQIFRNTPPVQHSIIARQAYLLDNQLVYVVSNRQVRECRIVRINGTDNGYFWRTELVEVYKLSPSEGGFNIGLMPTLPQKGMEYEWDCQNEPHWLPDKTLNEVKCGDRLIVVYPSWFTTRVRQAGNSGDASEFLVYTYHLKRS